MSDPIVTEMTATQPVSGIKLTEFVPTPNELALLRRIRERQRHAIECRIVVEIADNGAVSWFVTAHREGA